MNKQVITITLDGGMSGLQRKPGQGLDLRQFGKADIQRASLIQWDTEAQAWYIDVVQEAGKGVVTGLDYAEATTDLSSALATITELTRIAPSYQPGDSADDPLLFTEYDDAVTVEIAYLDALRLKGYY